MRRTFLFMSLLLLQCTTMSAQRDYEMFALEEYKSDTLYMENYTYVCDTISVFDFVNLYNIQNHPGRGDVKYKTGEPLLDLFGYDTEHLVVPTELNNKMGAIVDDAFTIEQAECLNGEEFWITLNVSSTTGKITDIYFAYDEFEKVEILKKLEGKKYTIQRSKGLGENEPDMMWMTTMNPETRRLIKVEPTDAQLTADVFDLLLGDNLQGRKEHIAEVGNQYIEFADIS